MGEIHNTQFFKTVQENKMDVSQVLEQVYIALTEKGYNPINQVISCLETQLILPVTRTPEV